MELDELTARERIRDTVARYNHAGDRGRLDELVLCFCEEGALAIGDEPELRGRSAIRERLERTVRDLAGSSARRLLRHHVTSTRIELLGSDDARAWSYFLAITDAGPDHAGRYVDRFQRVGDDWLIAQRRVRVEWQSEHSRLPGTWGRS